MNKLVNQLNHYMDAGFPLLYIETFEEVKADRLIALAAKNQNYDVIEYDANGLHFKAMGESKPNNNLSEILKHFMQPNEMTINYFNLDRKVLVLKDMMKNLEDSVIVGRLKYIAEKIIAGIYNCRIVIVSPIIKLPKELEHLITLLSMEYPQADEIGEIISDFCSSEQVTPPSRALKQKLIDAFKGMAEFEIKNVLALAVAKDGTINDDDLNLIREQKKQTIKKSGILEMVEVKDNIVDEVGGLENLISCLRRKRKILQNMAAAERFGVDKPKGLLIAGLPGCGKSLSAKAAADLFKIPLLRLDMGRLMGKYIGESEANLRNAIRQADAIAPCVLWLDELEKAFSGIGGQSANAEITTRLMGTFLTWLQEKESFTFVIATVNNIKNIPPEFLRKGRFDDVFYVDLPNDEEREKILRIHINKRRAQDLRYIDIQDIAWRMEGYSGADIEGVVKDAIEATFEQDVMTLSDTALIDAIEQMHPLSETMKDEIEEMREDYKKRNFKNAS